MPLPRFEDPFPEQQPLPINELDTSWLVSSVGSGEQNILREETMQEAIDRLGIEQTRLTLRTLGGGGGIQEDQVTPQNQNDIRNQYLRARGRPTFTYSDMQPFLSSPYEDAMKLNKNKLNIPNEKKPLYELKLDLLRRPVEELLKVFPMIDQELGWKSEAKNQYQDISIDEKTGLYALIKKIPSDVTKNNHIDSYTTYDSLNDRIPLDKFKSNVYLGYLKIKNFSNKIKKIDGISYDCVEYNSSRVLYPNLVYSSNLSGFTACYNPHGRTLYMDLEKKPYGLWMKKDYIDPETRQPTCIEKFSSINYNRISPVKYFEYIQSIYKSLCVKMSDELNRLQNQNNIQSRKPDTRTKKFMNNKQGTYISHKVPFSCEIECYGKSKKDVAIMSHAIDKTIGLCHDGSLRSEIGYPIEIQTPILLGKRGEIAIAELSTYLVENGFMVDKTCGLHIHLDGEVLGIKNEQVRVGISLPSKIVSLYLFHRLFEPVMISFLPSTRRLNRYCAAFSEPVSYNDRNVIALDIRDAFVKCENMNELSEFELMWYAARDYEAVQYEKMNRYTPTRYYGVNFHSLLKDGHFEIRYHSGTLNYEKIMYWIDLHGKVLEKCGNGSITIEGLKDIFKSNLSLKELTEVMFSILDLNKDTVEYLMDRQSKFKDVKASEEILIDKTKKLCVA